MARLAEAFTAATGHTLKLASGATGKFYSQIVAGAPFEVLLSADETTPRRLIAEAIEVIVFIAGRGLARRVETVARVAGLDPDGGYGIVDLIPSSSTAGA